MVFSASITKAKPNEPITCTQKLNELLTQHNATALNKIIFSDSVVKPWMRALNSHPKNTFDLRSLDDLLQPYGLSVIQGPQNSLLIQANPFASAPSTILYGRIIDKETKEPIRTGKITIHKDDITSRIDSNGCFLLVGIPKGDYKLSLHESGQDYIDINSTLNIQTDRASQIFIEVERNNNPKLEELFVYGTKDSSLDIKRKANGLVDHLDSAEIAQIPSTTPADTLQRFSGINTSRHNGEGRYVTARGFGGDYNMVTLNRRTLATASLLFNGAGDSSTRALDLSNFASESIESIEVYKTAKANLSSGGVGATVNINLARPLEIEKTQAEISLKSLYEIDNSEPNRFNPEISGQYNFLSANKKIGMHIGASYQERKNTSNGAFVSYWQTDIYNGALDFAPQLPLSGDALEVTNPPAIGQLYSMPSDLRYFHSERRRKRTNVLFSLQGMLTPDITATIDHFYSRQVHFENRSELSIWMDSYRSNIQFDNNQVATPILYWEERRELDPRDVGFALQQYNVKNINYSTGLNIRWQKDDFFEVYWDLHSSSASSIPNQDYGNWINIGIGANISRGQGVDFSQKLPILMLDFDDSQLINNGVLDIQELGSAVRQLYHDEELARLHQMQLESVFSFNNNDTLILGLDWRDTNNHYQSAKHETPFAGNWSIDNPGDIASHALQKIDYQTLFDTTWRTSNHAFFGQASNGRAHPFTTGYTGNAAQLGRQLSEAIDEPWNINTKNNIDRNIKEQIQAIYLLYSKTHQHSTWPLNVQAGLRYESTQLSSSSVAYQPEGIVWNSPFDMIFSNQSIYRVYSHTASYDHFLPNIDFDVQLLHGIKARLSYSKTISRPSYKYLDAAVNNLTEPTINNSTGGQFGGTATAGNPGLRPLESENFDISAQWYFLPQGYLHFGYFEKRINHYISVQNTRKSVPGLTDPSAGPRIAEALMQLESDNITINQQTTFQMMAANQLGVNYNVFSLDDFETRVAIDGLENDPLLPFHTTYPQDNIKVNVSGLELSIENQFDPSGFGFYANYTWVNNDSNYDALASPSTPQFGMADFGDIGNVGLTYNKFGVKAYIGLHWWEGFLNPISVNAIEPSFSEPGQQVDFKISYLFFEGLSVLVEGFNITGNHTRHHGRSAAQLVWYETLSPRYQIGLQYHF